MSNHQRNLPVPFFSQRENRYMWQRIAKNIQNGGESVTINQAQGINQTFYTAGANIGNEVSITWASCNIVSLAMILHYYGITDDSPQRIIPLKPQAEEARAEALSRRDRRVVIRKSRSFPRKLRLISLNFSIFPPRSPRLCVSARTSSLIPDFFYRLRGTRRAQR